jgi:hypothetical protein
VQGVFECWAAWNLVNATVTYMLVAAGAYNPGSQSGGYANMRAIVAGTPNGVGANVPQTWAIAGSCPSGYTETVTEAPGGSIINWNGASTESTTTWWITVAAWCIPNGAWFAFFNTWNPPELPIDWLLARGGTNTLAPLEPLYIKAWNEYVSMWLAENGFMLDLLILLALIMPILARPATRRLKLT